MVEWGLRNVFNKCKNRLLNILCLNIFRFYWFNKTYGMEILLAWSIVFCCFLENNSAFVRLYSYHAVVFKENVFRRFWKTHSSAHYWKWTIRIQVRTPNFCFGNILICRLPSINLILYTYNCRFKDYSVFFLRYFYNCWWQGPQILWNFLNSHKTCFSKKKIKALSELLIAQLLPKKTFWSKISKNYIQKTFSGRILAVRQLT